MTLVLFDSLKMHELTLALAALMTVTAASGMEDALDAVFLLISES